MCVHFSKLMLEINEIVYFVLCVDDDRSSIKDVF
jgi:hypothetical protein